MAFVCLDKDRYHGIFIRAPGIKSIDSDQVDILASYTAGDIEK